MNYRSLYFEYEKYPFASPPEMRGESQRRSVTIVGAGPVGLVAALALVRHGIDVTVVEDEDTVNIGSRAAGVSRRSLEILDRLGVGDRLMDKGVSWSKGQSYYGDRLVLDFSMPVSDALKHPPMINLQQCYVEKFILDELRKSPLATLLWSTAVTRASNQGDHVRVEAQTPQGPLEFKTDWLIACDGARSAVRSSLGLQMEGRSYEGRYVIADIRMKTDLPPGRRVWFDSPGNPGSTIILHRQPDDIWRIDYQLGPEEDHESAVQADRVRTRIQTFLDAVGIDSPWEIDWISLYRAHSISLREYRHGRVLFAGDAAHLVPIFGARGMNGGIDDAWNLAWKLAYVIQGRAPQSLLATYTEERHFAFTENIRNADKSTKVMAPATRGDELLRDAVLELAVDHEFVRPLLNPRQSSDIVLAKAALNGSDEMAQDEARVVGGVCPNIRVEVRTASGMPGQCHLHDLLGEHFTILAACAQNDLAAMAGTARGMAVKILTIVDDAGLAMPGDIIDANGAVRAAVGLRGGGALLIRPDQHVMARWSTATTDKAAAALGPLATWSE